MSLTGQGEGIEARRLDVFVDGAFAFILALLLSVPGRMWSIPGFMYALLFLIGPVANRFNRRYVQS